MRGTREGGFVLAILAAGLALFPGQARSQEPAPGRTVRAKVTAYCPCSKCCGKWSQWKKTATGRSAEEPGVAVDPLAIPYGSLVEVPGVGRRLADDTGGAMRTSWRRMGVVHIDVRMRTHEEARAWGVRWLAVTIYRPVVRTPRAAQ